MYILLVAFSREIRTDLLTTCMLNVDVRQNEVLKSLLHEINHLSGNAKGKTQQSTPSWPAESFGEEWRSEYS